MRIIEKDGTGKIFAVQMNGLRQHDRSTVASGLSQQVAARESVWFFNSWVNIMYNVFLPVGYPETVSPDYMRYSILNALQTFCSSLAGMLSSRATLEGYGVGNASASATDALLLSVLQDIIGRLTTILAAYYYGSSLMPEAKTYRFLADILIDLAIALDTLSPVLASFPAFLMLARIIPIPFRVYTLCLSSSLRALCGIAAGGSKTAITIHFATPVEGAGDLGDLSAKDSSKETVLGLFGMLLGTFIVPYLTTPFSTYFALCLLVFLHLCINFFAVRGVALRTLNRQRASIAWSIYQGPIETNSGATNHDAPSPVDVARMERIFHRPNIIRDITGEVLGRCTVGCSLGSGGVIPRTIFDLFEDDKYVLWFHPSCLSSTTTPDSSETVVFGKPHLLVFLKDGHRPSDQLKAWLHAVEVVRLAKQELVHIRRQSLHNSNLQMPADVDMTALQPGALIVASYLSIQRDFDPFVGSMLHARWMGSRIDSNHNQQLDVALLTGPVTVILDVQMEDRRESEELKKDK
ncbi:hypothetical protein E1B28_005200 [Marasmius oreades]|uniref:Protein root UVB sensitive/RUS domain-containing protein n=1 Tax=Marasmius oreades TaxID=181124 RepID=A0A9P8ADR6_9AGAR|nr:uncharacterized protein E1B28_005200 [Marasmius oreades]KAG7097887.1 hypothetical protein E1B28_005200 [Marasmius oreades]